MYVPKILIRNVFTRFILILTNAVADCRQQNHDKKTAGASLRSSSLPIDFGQGVGVGSRHQCVDIVDAVEDGDKVTEAGDESDRHLSSDSFGYIDSWFGDFFLENT